MSLSFFIGHRLLVMFSSHSFTSTGLTSCSVILLIFTFFDKNYQLFISFFDLMNNISILLIMNIEKGWHHDDIFDLAVVVTIVEELIEPIAGFLGFSDEQKMMFGLLITCLFDAFK